MAWRGHVTIDFCLLSNIASMAFIGLFGTSDVLYTYRVGYTAFLSLPFLSYLGKYGFWESTYRLADGGSWGSWATAWSGRVYLSISDLR